MLSVRSMQIKRYCLVLAFAIMGALSVFAQENSPFSRYGMGDVFPSQSVQYKGLGGMTAAQGNPMILQQPNLGSASINPDNPASYGFMRTRIGGDGGAVNYDLGVLADMRTLQRATPSASYNSSYFAPSYFTVALPVHSSGLGVAFGLKPLTRVSYNLRAEKGYAMNQFTGKMDSTVSNNIGSGGLNQAFVGLGKSIKGFRVGVNAAYTFGSKDYTAVSSIKNDTFVYETLMRKNVSRYSGFALDVGVQQTIKLKETEDPTSKVRSTYNLDLGVNASLPQKLNVKYEEGFFTAGYDPADAERIDPRAADTISYVDGAKGSITLPAQIKGGFMFNKYIGYISKWGIGAEYSMANWKDFKGVNNIADTALSNAWMIRAGGYFVPDPLRGTNIFSTARYSIGGYYGKDYVNVGNNGEGRNVMALTFGVGLMLRNQLYGYRAPSSMVNTSFEIGRRGSASNNIYENFYKVSVGFSLRDIWMQKRRYE